MRAGRAARQPAEVGGIEPGDSPPPEMRRHAAKRPYCAAETQIVGDLELLVGVIAADQPVELVVERLALQPQFLAEGLELRDGIAVGRAVEDVDVAIVDVATAWSLE